jgi:hypothetical protein
MVDHRGRKSRNPGLLKLKILKWWWAGDLPARSSRYDAGAVWRCWDWGLPSAWAWQWQTPKLGARSGPVPAVKKSAIINIQDKRARGREHASKTPASAARLRQTGGSPTCSAGSRTTVGYEMQWDSARPDGT